MLCRVADYSGFCHGVRNTISIINELLKISKKKVSCIGLPVHNPQVTAKLVSAGLHVVDDISEINEGILVVRAHGLPPKKLAEAAEKGIEVIDTTCKIVNNVQRLAENLVKENYDLIITGEPNHPEVKSIFGYSQEKGIICSHPHDLMAFRKVKKIGVVSQTTYSESYFEEIINYLSTQHFNELRIFKTICSSIARRRIAAENVARTVDIMLVIGGFMSSNTKRLFEACSVINMRTYHIESYNDIQKEWLQDVDTIGITAGASTPQWLIDEVKSSLACTNSDQS